MKKSKNKSELALNKVYKFSGGKVALHPSGKQINEDVPPCRVRVTEFVPLAPYGYRIRPIEKSTGKEYGFVDKASLTAE